MGDHSLRQGIFPRPGIEPASLALTDDSFLLSRQGSTQLVYGGAQTHAFLTTSQVVFIAANAGTNTLKTTTLESSLPD